LAWDSSRIGETPRDPAPAPYCPSPSDCFWFFLGPQSFLTPVCGCIFFPLVLVCSPDRPPTSAFCFPSPPPYRFYLRRAWPTLPLWPADPIWLRVLTFTPRPLEQHFDCRNVVPRCGFPLVWEDPPRSVPISGSFVFGAFFFFSTKAH